MEKYNFYPIFQVLNCKLEALFALSMNFTNQQYFEKFVHEGLHTYPVNYFLSQMSQISPMSQMSQVFKMSQMSQVSQMSKRSQVSQVSQVSKMSQVSQVSQMSQLSQVSQMSQGTLEC